MNNIKLVILDVDGVLTDGRIIYDDKGNEYKIFDVQDGYGIEMLLKSGVKVAIVSGRISPIVDKRAKECGVMDVFQGVRDKTDALNKLLKKYKLERSDVCVVGDDILDLSLMQKSGFPIAVANARPELKAIAKYVTTARGGMGAVREIAELIIETYI